MMKSSDKQLIWNGMETIYTAKQLLREQRNIALKLPPDFHHTLFSHFHPDANPRQVDTVDTSGGPELLEKIAEIRGLEEITHLIPLVTETGAKIHVVSPSPSINIYF
ncbi:conserved hypothetical protein [Nitrosococcus halophilus Nc 4]|uniref:Uncharacterized protein n=1 Tax=Nitrosococcus halophilus (strain Nc4) TaxID=472759 RepID=D5BZP9_NITHN|nr:hypothetical protein [Nitrosococcus halophilus]ADE14344.1 conserved hypothetical protein [Nitrosococcus halophilus Nc 4]